MKKFVLFLFMLLLFVTVQATDDINAYNEVETVNITVPLPTNYGYNGGSITLKNVITGKNYYLSNGSAWYDAVVYTVEKGTYEVTAITVGPCNGTPKATYSTNGLYTLYLGSKIDIQYSGGLIFGCQ